MLAAEMLRSCFWLGARCSVAYIIACLYNGNDAFSSLRIGAYNNFLRFRLTEDCFDMFVVGLESVPQRDDWVANPKRDKNKPDPEVPMFRKLNSNRI
ncbi:hypothetical protein [Bradyrhizobium sp. RT9a]|uniref:hypothetical protein n=1 Tax=Bradyrhizobium sp. RT9a TaxID=3156384 RepID=UPI003395A389